MKFFEVTRYIHDPILLEWLDARLVIKYFMALEADASVNKVAMLNAFLFTLSASPHESSIEKRILLATYLLKQPDVLLKDFTSVKEITDNFNKRMIELPHPGPIKSVSAVFLHRWNMLNLIASLDQRRFSLNETELDCIIEEASRLPATPHYKQLFSHLFQVFSPEMRDLFFEKISAFLSGDKEDEKRKAVQLFEISAPLMSQEIITGFLARIAFLAYSSEISTFEMNNRNPFSDELIESDVCSDFGSVDIGEDPNFNSFDINEHSDLGSIDFERDIARTEFTIENSMRIDKNSLRIDKSMRWLAMCTFNKTVRYLSNKSIPERLIQQQTHYLKEQLDAVLVRRCVSLKDISNLALDRKIELFLNHLKNKIETFELTCYIVLDVQLLSICLLSFSEVSLNKFLFFLVKTLVEHWDDGYSDCLIDVFDTVISYLMPATVDHETIEYLINKISSFQANDMQARDSLRYLSRLASLLLPKKRIELFQRIYNVAKKICNDEYDKYIFKSLEAIAEVICRDGGEKFLGEMAIVQLDEIKNCIQKGENKKKYFSYYLLLLFLPYTNVFTKGIIAQFFYHLLQSDDASDIHMAICYFRNLKEEKISLGRIFFEESCLANTLYILYQKTPAPDYERIDILHLLIYFFKFLTTEQQDFLQSEIHERLGSQDRQDNFYGVSLIVDFSRVDASCGPFSNDVSNSFVKKDFFKTINSAHMKFKAVYAFAHSDIYFALSCEVIKDALNYLNEDFPFSGRDEKNKVMMLALDMLTVLIVRNVDVSIHLALLESMGKNFEAMMLKQFRSAHLHVLGVFAHHDVQPEATASNSLQA